MWVQAGVAVLALVAGIAALVVRKVRWQAPLHCTAPKESLWMCQLLPRTAGHIYLLCVPTVVVPPELRSDVSRAGRRAELQYFPVVVEI